MNCHRDNRKNQDNCNHSPLKHMLHMILCCGLPIVIIGILPFVSRFNPSTASILSKIAPFICPLMMLGMIAMMLRGNKKKSCCDDTCEKHNNKLFD
ncbi:hypothetical protein RBU49_06250 [Clostridium sp. MB40-C1]|uniref:hypothetical protein n=1 Tax=Clostridium sp. MB40-C1 TaxID=3070996 RepID=UPI0027DECD15|nr:hypothetical protein [Clostridium sp. MB40-C1]WMJ81845.1 hypothetical protein RBU49_06250 [Clostridium sp. MB40-C1]